jgi:hypothetical protein
MGFRFEFDSVNKLLLVRVEGPLTNDLLTECYEEIRHHSTATDAHSGICDFSSVTDWLVSTELVRQLARREPAMPDPTRQRVLVSPQTNAYGLLRMFQILGEPRRPLLHVARTLDEALAILGVRSAHFEPLA